MSLDKAPEIDVVLREVQGYGYLPTVLVDGKKIYHGEFQADIGEALERAMTVVRKVKEARGIV